MIFCSIVFSAVSSDDEFLSEDLFDCDSNERIVEGASSPDQLTRSVCDEIENGLWGLRITIERLDLLPDDFTDVFCQFSLFGRCEESWSTEPIQIHKGSADVDATWELAVKAGPELLKVRTKTLFEATEMLNILSEGK